MTMSHNLIKKVIFVFEFLYQTSRKPRFSTITAGNNFVLVKTNFFQFDQETFGTKYVPKVKKKFGAWFFPKELTLVVMLNRTGWFPV